MKLRTTITPPSVPRMKKIVEHAIELGADYVHLEPCGDLGRARNSENRMPFDGGQFIDKFLELWPWAMKQNVTLFSSSLLCLKPGDGSFCGAQGPMTGVTPSGMQANCSKVCSANTPGASNYLYGEIREDAQFHFNKSQMESLRIRRGPDMIIAATASLL